MKKSTLIESFEFIIIMNERIISWLWFCKIEQWIPAKNVRKREDINWVVKVITLPESLQASSEADKRKFFEVCHDFLGKRYGFDNIVGRSPHGRTTYTCTQKSLQSSMTKKTNTIGRGDMFNRMDLKILSHKDLSVRLETSSVWRGRVWK